MPEVLLFGEDHGHEVVVGNLTQRLATEAGVALQVRTRSATGGHGRMLSELRQFVSELGRGRVVLPVVAAVPAATVAAVTVVGAAALRRVGAATLRRTLRPVREAGRMAGGICVSSGRPRRRRARLSP